MKKMILSIIISGIMMMSFSQIATVRKDLLNLAVKAERDASLHDLGNYTLPVNPSAREVLLSPNETTIGSTYFDLQSNSCLSNRISFHPDGTIGAVWTYGMQASSFPDRGTGYNYYNGTSWGAQPGSRIEDIRCGWPSYDTWGTAGEINVSHNGTTGLEISKRTNRGAGNWTQTLFQGPAGIEDSPTWPRLVTSGTNHDYIHLIYNSYVPYQGQNTAMLYSRSGDGGVTWSPHNIILTGTGSSYYNEIGPDEYVMAANGSSVAILCADAFYDMFVMKSTDNGATWTKTVIWNHPYPFFNWNTTITDTFFCVDNSASVAIGQDGKVHVVFGINRVLHDQPGTTYSYFPYVDGIGYWNEDMAPFSNNIHALAPPSYGYANSEMTTDVNYIGWSQDVDGDGIISLIGVVSYREMGLSTMPSITVDDANNVFVAYASTTETYSNYIDNYKKIWMRGWEPNSWGNFVNITDDIVHIFDESIYPVLSHTSSTDDLHLIYQADVMPGLALDGDHDYVINYIIHSEIPKTDLVSGITYYNVATSSYPANGGITSGDGLYAMGTSATIIATANINWDFEKWTENDTLVTTNPSYTFMVNSNRNFVAHFNQVNGVVSTASVPPDGGTTTGDGTYPMLDSATVTASVNPDFMFEKWIENGIVMSTDSIYTFEITGDHSLLAHFHYLYHEVTITPEPIQGGITSGDGTYYEGDTVNLLATPNPGWGFENWTENDTLVSSDSLYIFEIYTDRDFTANFYPFEFTIATVSSPPEGGTTSGAGIYGFGDEATVTASPNAYWSFANWTENDSIVSEEISYTFLVTEDRTLEANFIQDTCEITTAANPPEGGTTSGDGVFLQGDTVIVSAEVNNMWEFISWTQNGTVVSYNAAYTFIASYSCLLTANFDFIFALDEPYSEKAKIYPLPSSGIITIEIGSKIKEDVDEIRLIDLTGNHLKTIYPSGKNKIQLDLGHYNSGVYIIQFVCKNTLISAERILIK